LKRPFDAYGFALLQCDDSVHQDCDVGMRGDEAMVERPQLQCVMARQTGQIGVGDLLVAKRHAPVGAANIDIRRDEEMPPITTNAFHYRANLVNADAAVVRTLRQVAENATCVAPTALT